MAYYFEATMASGCPVITTNESPMSEVAGEAGFLIPVKPVSQIETVHWSYNGAKDYLKKY